MKFNNNKIFTSAANDWPFRVCSEPTVGLAPQCI